MKMTGISRRTAVLVACLGVVLAAPTGAMALTTHSATSSTKNSNLQLVATAKCGAGEHVVSGGFKDSTTGATAVVSHAVHGDSWTVHTDGTTLLTTYAYCGRKGPALSTHETQVPGVAPPPNTTAAARCASGQTLVSGGYGFLATSPSTQNGSTAYGDYAASSRGWKLTAAFESVPVTLAVFAYCQPGVNVKVRSKSGAPIPADGDGSASASCHKGETLLAGGYTTTPKPDWNNSSGPDLFYNASYRSGSRSWTARAHNFSNVSGSITAFAYCEA
jgi:hypothetical protein